MDELFTGRSAYLLYEILVTFRLITEGKPGPLSRRYFANARDAMRFVANLDALAPPNGALTTLSLREVGRFEPLERLRLEAMAVEEGTRR